MPLEKVITEAKNTGMGKKQNIDRSRSHKKTYRSGVTLFIWATYAALICNKITALWRRGRGSQHFPTRLSPGKGPRLCGTGFSLWYGHSVYLAIIEQWFLSLFRDNFPPIGWGQRESIGGILDSWPTDDLGQYLHYEELEDKIDDFYPDNQKLHEVEVLFIELFSCLLHICTKWFWG